MTVVNDPVLEEGLRSTAQMLLDLMRKRVASRRTRVLVFARATRVALDALSPAEQGPGFVLRTWELPELSATTLKAMSFILSAIDRCITTTGARAFLLSRVTRLAIDDLSPDEQIGVLAEASQIIGTPP